jgi:nucleoside-diphosphate-sugar epimerase
VHVLNGAFLDMFAHPGAALELDDERGVARFWGTGAERFEATTVDDTAYYAALAAVDLDLKPGKLAVAGDRVSFGGMLDAVEEVTGRTYERASRGTVQELEAEVARARAEDPTRMAATIGGYQVAMLTGRTALEDLQNDRYPQVRPETFRDVLRRLRGQGAATRG